MEEKKIAAAEKNAAGGKMKGKHKKQKFSIFMLILGVVLGIYTVSMFLPMIWGILCSFKENIDFRLNMFGLPKPWSPENYKIAVSAFQVPVESGAGFRSVGALEMLLYSVLYAVGGALLQAFMQFVMAYVSARFRYKFGKIVYAIVIFAMVFPTVGSTASSIYIARVLHLYDSIPGIYVIKSYFLGMYFLIFYEQLKAFPKDFTEAAYIDGAGNFTVMFRIIFPMVSGTFFTVVLLLFIANWNDYTTPMLYMPNRPTLSYGLYYFNNLSRDNVVMSTPVRLASCAMMALPLIILFLCFHKRLIGNVSMGGIKE